MIETHALHVPPELFADVQRSAVRQVLVMAENEVAGRALLDLLAETGQQGYLARDASEAARLVAQNRHLDLAIVQAQGPSLDLWWLLDGLLQLRPHLTVVSAFDDAEPLNHGVELPIDLALSPGWDICELFARLPEPASAGRAAAAAFLAHR